jgi:tetratricopeptide (TPR) repeat protein
VLLFFEHDWDAAANAYRTALSLAPYSVTARLLSAWHLVFSERSDEAIQELQRALFVDPASVLLNSTLGVALYYGGKPDEAAAQLQETLLFDEDSPLARYYYALVLADQGEYDGALCFLQGLVEASYEPQATALSGYIFARTGRADAAREAQTRVVMPRDRRPSYFNAALISVGLGDRAGALDYLERAYRAHEPPLILAPIHPIYTAALKNEPRFVYLVRAMHRSRQPHFRANGKA